MQLFTDQLNMDKFGTAYFAFFFEFHYFFSNLLYFVLAGAGDMEICYGSSSYIGLYMFKQAFKDLSYVGGSFTVLGLFMFIQTG